MGTGPNDSCFQHPNPQVCFEEDCVWDFQADLCHTPGGGGQQPPPQCEPKPQDEQCVGCVKWFCCQAVESCAQDPECGCLLDCLAQNQPLLQCQGDCGASAAVAFLTMCAGDACLDACG